MKKRILTFIIALCAIINLAGVLSNFAYAADSTGNSVFENVDYTKSTDIRVNLDGNQIKFDVKPQMINNRTLVPMRAICEAMGLIVTWDNNKRTATATDGKNKIIFTADSKTVLVNGSAKYLDVPATIINSRVVMPVRFLSENMGYNVVWVGESNLILLSKNDIVEWRKDMVTNELVKYINGVLVISNDLPESPSRGEVREEFLIYLSPSNQPANLYAVGNTTEKAEMEAIANIVKDMLNNEYKCKAVIGSIFGTSFEGRPAEAAEMGADVYIAMHSNASGTTVASGAEAFYHPDDITGKLLANNIVNELNKIAPLNPTRYTQVKSGMDAFGGYGYGEIRTPNQYNLVTALIETDFHDNPTVANWIINNKVEIARAYVNGIVSTFNLERR